MSRAFSNQNNKLSSGDLTKREGFRNKYTMINKKPNILLNRSSIDNKRIDYSDYNYIIGQKKILHCLSGNTTNDRIIRNTGGEIYLGNGMTLSRDPLTTTNICDINDGPLNFFTKHNHYILDNKKFLDYNKSGFCNFDICFGVNSPPHTETVKNINFKIDISKFSNYFPINQIKILDISGTYTTDLDVTKSLLEYREDISFSYILSQNYIQFRFNHFEAIMSVSFDLITTAPLCLSHIQHFSVAFREDIKIYPINLQQLYRLIIIDYSSNLINLSKLQSSGLPNLYATGFNGSRNLAHDTSFNNSTTLPELRIDTLPKNAGNLSYMLKDSSLNQNISDWDVSEITNMKGMFQDASCDNIGKIDVWNVKNVKYMQYMFMGSNFNKPLNDWSVNNVQNMASMFAGTSSQKNPFNQPLNKWNVEKVKNMEAMFKDSSFNQDVNDWSVNNVTNMASMFAGSSFNQDINSWDVSALTNAAGMFKDSSFNKDIGNWNIQNLFRNLYSNHVNFESMFTHSSLSTENNDKIYLGFLNTIHYDLIGTDKWNVMHWWGTDKFWAIKALAQTGLNLPKPFPVTSKDLLYRLIIEDFSSNLILLSDLSNLNNLYNGAGFGSAPISDACFNNSITLPGLQIGTLSGDFISLDYMLAGSDLNDNVDITGWDVSAVKSMQGMFMGSSFNQDISSWNVKNVQDMCGMFLDSSFNNSSIEKWNVSNVTNMYNLFPWTNTQIDISNWDISALFTSKTTINSENYPGFYRIFGDFWVVEEHVLHHNYAGAFDGSNNLSSTVNNSIWNNWYLKLNEISNNLISSFSLPFGRETNPSPWSNPKRNETGTFSKFKWTGDDNSWWEGSDWGNKIEKALKITGLKKPEPEPEP